MKQQPVRTRSIRLVSLRSCTISTFSSPAGREVDGILDQRDYSCGAIPSGVEVKRANVSAAFFLSIEFRQTGYLVEKIIKLLMETALARQPSMGHISFQFQSSASMSFLPDTQEIGQDVIVGRSGWETGPGKQQAGLPLIRAAPALQLRRMRTR